MEGATTFVLLVGKGLHGASDLTAHLRRRNCECVFAASCEEACRLVEARQFSVVLSENLLGDCGVSCLIRSLAQTPASMFLHVAVEDGCWWVPAVREGRPCLGDPALRPGAFAAILERILPLAQRVHAPPASLRPAAKARDADELKSCA